MPPLRAVQRGGNVMTSGSPGDQVELVAFDVGEGRPAGLVPLQVAEPVGAQAQQALGLGLEGVADQIEVQAGFVDFLLKHLGVCDVWNGGSSLAGGAGYLV